MVAMMRSSTHEYLVNNERTQVAVTKLGRVSLLQNRFFFSVFFSQCTFSRLR